MARVFYGAQATDDCLTEWNAIKVYQDGNPIHLGGPFGIREEAEDCADTHKEKDMINFQLATFEKHLVEAVKETRRQLQQVEKLDSFEFTIKAEGRVHEGEVKITFKLDHPYESAVEVRGNSISSVIEEFLRRHGWNKEHASLMLPNVEVA